MAILQLTLKPDPLLRKTLDEVTDVADEDFQKLIEDMRVTMVAAQGIGLSANQIGRNLRVFTIDRSMAKEHRIPDVFINPVVEETSRKQAVMNEGCLSIPGKFEDVRRAAEITVSAMDEKGKSFNVHAKGLLARLLQHEIDHLNGFLFEDRM